MIATHGGVGFHCERLLSLACADALRDGKYDVVSVVSVLYRLDDSVAAAIALQRKRDSFFRELFAGILEDNPLFNCGYGSNPTMSGTVECEAGFMSSDGLRFGGVGTVSRLQNPCQVAKAIAFTEANSELVSPMVLVGSGAEEWAEGKGFLLREPAKMIAPHTTTAWKKARDAISHTASVGGFKMDTVGAISIVKDVVEACTSSGGLILKSPGRLGHCAMFGGGTWAERRGSRSIGVSVSGCGEAIMRANFSRSLADRLLERDPDELSSSVVHSFFEHEFLHSNLTSPITANRLYAGGLVLLQEEGELCELIVFHNTPVLPFAYCKGEVVRRGLSKLPAGSNILVESYPCR